MTEQDDTHEAQVELRRILAENGLDDDGASPHSWRCEHPDRYPGGCTCVAEIIDDIIAAGYRKRPEPEWEYGAGYEAYNGVEMRWFSMGGEAYTVREAAENEVARFRDPLVRLVRRTRPGPWVPVGDAE